MNFKPFRPETLHTILYNLFLRKLYYLIVVVLGNYSRLPSSFLFLVLFIYICNRLIGPVPVDFQCMMSQWDAARKEKNMVLVGLFSMKDLWF